MDVKRPAAVAIKVTPRITHREPLQETAVLRVAKVPFQLPHRELAIAVIINEV